jgi:hypothetical protein
MKKFKLLSIILSLVIVAVVGLSACAGNAADFLQQQNSHDDGFLTSGGTALASDVPPNALFSVTFVNSRLQPTTFNNNIIVNEPTSPPEQGYVFLGWFLSMTAETRVTFPLQLVADTVLFARWTTDGVMIINTVQQLKNVQFAMSGRFELGQNLDLRGEDWNPLGLTIVDSETEGRVTLADEIVPFTGELNGRNFSIVGLNMTPRGPDDQFGHLMYGLFAVLGEGSLVQNLNFANARIELNGGFSSFYLGALAGRMDGGFVRNVVASNVRINNPEVRYEGGFLDDFFFSGARPTTSTFIGGLIGGVVEGEIVNSATSGAVVSRSVANGVFVGGLAGFNLGGIIRQSSSFANVEGRYAGGLVGYNNGYILGSNATGTVVGSLAYPAVAGGLTAYNDIDGIIERSFALGTVSARTAGGLVGINSYNFSINPPLKLGGEVIINALGLDREALGAGIGGIVRNSYAAGNVSASEFAGGLIGRAEANMPVRGAMDQKENRYFIENCFAFGNVEARAEQIIFKDSSGNDVHNLGVFHSVFAGGIIGHAAELRISAVAAFGNVVAESKRPNTEGGFTFNTVYAGNVVGHSTGQLIFDGNISVYHYTPARFLHGVTTQTVTRNAVTFSGYGNGIGVNWAQALEPEQFNDTAFLLNSPYSLLNAGLGFDPAIWNFDDINFALGRYPTLRAL